MGRHCTVCDLDRAHEANIALVHREPYRTIAHQFGVSVDALKRHAADHLPKLLVESSKAVEVSQADDLVGRLEGITSETREILRETRDSDEPDNALALKAIARLEKQLELEARILEVIETRPEVNILLSPQWIEFRTTIIEALRGPPPP